MKAYERLLKYVQYPTGSDESSETCPSTPEQLVLGAALCDEMRELGISNVEMDENGYVYGEIPASEGCEKAPVIGFVAHMDVVDEVPFTDIKPKIVDYKGGDVVLNEELGIVLSPKDFPEMNDCIGKHIIVTDGTTLLGADDKNGVAEIITAAEELLAHPEIKHGTIKIGFTPDEEIGRGAHKFNLERFGADYAYTMDGGEIGELEFENFNAASAKIHIQGRNVHPGYAKDKMKNAIIIGMELNDLLPVGQRPELTEGYDGFFHIISFNGTVEEANFGYIIRDHDRKKFEDKKEIIRKCVDFINMKYGEGTATLEVKDQYYNMREQVEPYYFIVEKAIKAMEMADIKPKIQPIRGGTDGANLSFKGLPCPNIFAGGLNFHGKMEFATLENIEKASQVVLNIIKLYAE